MEELLADFAFRNNKLRSASFRISAPVGIGMNEKMILPTFVQNALRNKPLYIYGKGTHEQSFVHVNDISQALYKALNSGKCHGVYNLFSYNRISNLNLAKKCLALLHSKSEINFLREGDSQDNDIWNVCIDKLISGTDYFLEVSIDYAINELAVFYSSHSSIAGSFNNANIMYWRGTIFWNPHVKKAFRMRTRNHYGYKRNVA